MTLRDFIRINGLKTHVKYDSKDPFASATISKLTDIVELEVPGRKDTLKSYDWLQAILNIDVDHELEKAQRPNYPGIKAIIK